MATPLELYYKKVYGVDNINFVENPVTATVGTSATKILNANSNRIAAYIFNLSANFGFTAPSPSVSSSLGFYLGKNSGNIITNIKDDGIIVTKDWWALNDTASGTWYIIELIAGT